MIRADFEHVTRNFHTNICISISSLLERHGINELSFENNHTAEVLFDFGELLVKLRVDAVRNKQGLEVRDEESGHWYRIDADSDVVLCSIAKVYTLTLEALSLMCNYTTIEYRGKEYDCRMVFSLDVNITEKDESNILIAPLSLLSSIEANEDLDGNTDQIVYYYTDDKNLNLPYGALCDCLIKEGID